MNNLYWTLRWDSYSDGVNELQKLEKEALVALAFNEIINDFIANYADYDEWEEDIHWHGKRIPYIWWFWRSVDFYNKNISIGECGDFIWFMENNKWDYPERSLTDGECESVLSIIWNAKKESEKCGSLSDIRKSTHQELDRLWDLFQSFTK